MLDSVDLVAAQYLCWTVLFVMADRPIFHTLFTDCLDCIRYYLFILVDRTYYARIVFKDLAISVVINKAPNF